MTSVSHEEYVIRKLRGNPRFVAEYLNAALEDAEEPAVLRIALRRSAEANGGIAKVAKAAGVEREGLHRALSTRGNPRLSTLVAVTKAVGLKLRLKPRGDLVPLLTLVIPAFACVIPVPLRRRPGTHPGFRAYA